MDDKIIITNVSVLKKKYGSGFKKIESTIKKLITADKKRGLQTRLIAIDDAATMKPFKASPVTTAASPKQNKQAIDRASRLRERGSPTPMSRRPDR